MSTTADWCATCGAPLDAADHDGCAARLALDPPRYCTRCGRRLDVQITPTSLRATCRRCDGLHPARDVIPYRPSA